MPHTFPHEAEDNHLMRRLSMFGEVRLYAPETEPSTWGREGWLLMTETGAFRNGMVEEDRNGPGIRVLVKASEAVRLFENTHHLKVDDIWLDRLAEVEHAL